MIPTKFQIIQHNDGAITIECPVFVNITVDHPMINGEKLRGESLVAAIHDIINSEQRNYPSLPLPDQSAELFAVEYGLRGTALDVSSTDPLTPESIINQLTS